MNRLIAPNLRRLDSSAAIDYLERIDFGRRLGLAFEMRADDLPYIDTRPARGAN